ncbi:MAG: hypothetical protein OEM66_07440 [Acidimicrobiia bacterium]|nr:hypothetical protein [Acidimicrobiia bacterium]
MNYLGSPMYGVLDEHGGAVVGVALAGLVYLVLRHRGRLEGYRRLATIEKLAISLLALDGFAHIGLAFSHGGGLGIAFLAFGAALLWLVKRALVGKSIRKPAGWLMAGSIGAFVVSSFAGSTPDQVALLTKLAELTVLAIVARPQKATRVRRWAESWSVVAATVLVAVGSWAGAFGGAGDGHHAGETPPPGTLLPNVDNRLPTAEEQADAEKLYRAVALAIAPYQDIEVAAEAGYAVEGMEGTGWHADKPAFKKDGRVFDPGAVETLVYAKGPEGPILLGAMFQMDEIGQPGPAVGGPLTVWHAHERVCLNLIPLSLGGLTGPFGSCPLGTVTIPITNEMIHVWTAPGAPEAFGHLDDEWIAEFVATR